VIEAVLVNHNTADYAELALRSLHVLNPDVQLTVTLLDNDSTEDATELFEYARSRGVAVAQTGYSVDIGRNTHGENLTRFMLDRPEAEKFLLMDSDICFLEAGTIAAMERALDARQDAWAVQAKMLPFAALLRDDWKPSGPREMFWRVILQFGRDFTAADAEAASRAVKTSYHGEIQERPHPYCLLIRNTPTLRRVLRTVGMSTGFINADLPLGGWYDTAALAARVLSTHQLEWFVGDVPEVLHYAFVSQRQEDPKLMATKVDDCRRRLAEYREREGSA
jgi:hypothetical protein